MHRPLPRSVLRPAALGLLFGLLLGPFAGSIPSQEEDPPQPKAPASTEDAEDSPVQSKDAPEAEGQDPKAEPPEESLTDPAESEAPEETDATFDPTQATEPAEADFSVPDAMKVFKHHTGSWRGLSKSRISENGETTETTARSEWRGGYRMSGHVFEVRGYDYGTLGRTQYEWQYSFDRLKERYLAVYHDSQGRTFFFEGVVNEGTTKLVWRLVNPPGDMTWRAELDLVPDDGIEVNGTIASETYGYKRAYKGVYERKHS